MKIRLSSGVCTHKVNEHEHCPNTAEFSIDGKNLCKFHAKEIIKTHKDKIVMKLLELVTVIEKLEDDTTLRNMMYNNYWVVDLK